MIYVVYIIWAVLHLLATILPCIAIILIYDFTSTRLKKYYNRLKRKRRLRQWEKDYTLILQERRRIELRRKEREKYPLFYLKDGIV